MSNILVTGGAGYIGSHVVLELAEAGFNPISYDNLSNGYKNSVLKGKLIIADVADKKVLSKVLREEKITAVLHLAGLIDCAQSLKNPEKYIQINYKYGLNLLEEMLKNNIKNIVFSSSAAVYGNQEKMPIFEEASVNPKSPYAESKLMFEEALIKYHKLGINYLIFRYFNAAGADEQGRIGLRAKVQNNLITTAIRTALGQQKKLLLFGDDYETADGTCIRDYVHVTDLAKAHVLGLNYLFSGGKSVIINLGSGKGYSNNRVIAKVKEISGQDFNVKTVGRRDGDLAVSVASIIKAQKFIKWIPEYDLDSIINTAYKWYTAGFINAI